MRKKRQEEIEAKKKRLEELKRAKELAANAPKSAEPSPKGPFPSAPSATVAASSAFSHFPIHTEERSTPAQESKADHNQGTEDLVSSLLATHRGGAQQGSTEKKFDVQYNRSEKIKSFAISRVSAQILPVEKVTYEKECQTEEDDRTFMQDFDEDKDDDRYGGGFDSKHSSIRFNAAPITLNFESALQGGDGHPTTPGRKALGRHGSHSAVTGMGGLNKASSFHSVFSEAANANTTGGLLSNANSFRKISEEEKQQMLMDDKFLTFFESASLHIERALEFNDSFDVLRDYTLDTSKQSGSGERAVVHTQTYYECESLKQRPVMDLKCSSLRPELFLAAYGSKPSLHITSAGKAATSSSTSQQGTGEDDAPGLVCIWAKDLHSRPEIKLIASSPVLTATFHHQEPQLVFGGCYNGQILLWDMSKSRSLPVQRSSWIAGKGHKHPVYAMALTMSHELVTVSIDGMLCLWDVSRLTEPITTVMLEIPVLKTLSPSELPPSSSLFSPTPNEIRVQQPPLNVSCLAYGQSDNASHIIVGSGAGELFKSQLPYKQTDVANVKVSAMIPYHAGFAEKVINCLGLNLMSIYCSG